MSVAASTTPRDWQVEDVLQWAESVKLSKDVTAALEDNEVDGYTLLTLTKDEIRSELGIKSLAARRYLAEAIDRLKVEDESMDYSMAIDIYAAEVQAIPKTIKNKEMSINNKKSIQYIVHALRTEAKIQQQIVKDRLMSLHVEKALSAGQQAVEDAEFASAVQKTISHQEIQLEYDRSFALSLSPQQGRNTRVTRNTVKSLFTLCIEACVRYQINVSAALATGRVQPIPQGIHVRDEEDVDVEMMDAATVVAGNVPTTRINKIVKTKKFAEGDSLPLVTCSVCFSENSPGFSLGCTHSYCKVCMTGMLKVAMQDTSKLPLRCCKLPIDNSVFSILLPRHEADTLKLRTWEIETNKKMHCPTCNAFISLDAIPTTEASVNFLCDCRTELCSSCCTKSHPHFTCKENKAIVTGSDEPLFELAQNKGWKQCPKCSAMIEFLAGCVHMTCKCRHEFCYECLRTWTGSCNCVLRNQLR